MVKKTTCAGGHFDHHTYTKYMDKEPRKIRKILSAAGEKKGLHYAHKSELRAGYFLVRSALRFASRTRTLLCREKEREKRNRMPLRD